MIVNDQSLKRDKTRPIKVLVTDEERAEIEHRAKQAALPPSTYLRVVGLGYELKSCLDQQAILDLIKVNADQGRLGGLLKLWLTQLPSQGASTNEVRKLLKDIEATQKGLKALLDRL